MIEILIHLIQIKANNKRIIRALAQKPIQFKCSVIMFDYK